MGDFVGDDIDQRTVAGEQRWRHEGESRIFHTPERKTRWQNEQVVALPKVRSVKIFGRAEHCLHLRELPGCGIDDRRLGVNAAARPKTAELQFANCERKQIGRDRLRHLERINAIRGVLRAVCRAHDCEQSHRYPERR